MIYTPKKLPTTSTSELSLLATCPRKYMYQNIRGWRPKTGSDAMDMGSAFHLCAAEGYRYIKNGGDPQMWPSIAVAHAGSKLMDRFVDRELALDEDQRRALADMLAYYWQYTGQFDHFDEILAVEEEVYFEFNGWMIRITIDLLVRVEGEPVVIDHKTSGDISGDMAHLPLDLQTHLYYYGAWKHYGKPLMFIHNFQRRFDFTSKQRTGPPNWTRSDGTKPYLLTESGKVATRSDDPNDYVRRVRTPLTVKQLEAFEEELTARTSLLNYHYMSDRWPRNDQKLGFGCGSCPYYAPCTAEADGNEVSPMLIEMNYDVEKK